MTSFNLEKTAKDLVADGKGILAADESTGTIEKRFKSINVPQSESNRRDYREMLFTTENLGSYISGVILYDETLRQKAEDGTRLVDILNRQGVIPGIKVDRGTKTLPFSSHEKITEGLDGLKERLVEYRELGARFAKWRAVIEITDTAPTDACIYTNAHALARYAALCQSENIVPIVEPEVIMDGSHTIERCYEVTEKTLFRVFEELRWQNVKLEQMLLKPNMVISGTQCSRKASTEEIARLTLQCFKRTVPAAVSGIVFLSGGQSDEEATLNLNSMNKQRKDLPWKLSFSYGRALQTGALKGWAGSRRNFSAGQKAFYHRSRMNSLATLGNYSTNLESSI